MKVGADQVPGTNACLAAALRRDGCHAQARSRSFANDCRDDQLATLCRLPPACSEIEISIVGSLQCANSPSTAQPVASSCSMLRPSVWPTAFRSLVSDGHGRHTGQTSLLRSSSSENQTKNICDSADVAGHCCILFVPQLIACRLPEV